jgi:hypothetical protein
MRVQGMDVSKKTIQKLQRKVSRQIEIEEGRQSYGRIHQSKVAYNRRKEKKIVVDDWN